MMAKRRLPEFYVGDPRSNPAVVQSLEKRLDNYLVLHGSEVRFSLALTPQLCAVDFTTCIDFGL
jgi:hypothetical protein